MKLQLQPVFICISITSKPKLYIARFRASVHVLLEAERGQWFSQKKQINVRIILVTLSRVQIK